MPPRIPRDLDSRVAAVVEHVLDVTAGRPNLADLRDRALRIVLHEPPTSPLTAASEVVVVVS